MMGNRTVEADSATMTIYGSLFSKLEMPLKTRTTYMWDVVNPAAQLNWHCSFSSTFSKALDALVAGNLHATLDLVVYTDEAAPGDLLSVDHTRKALVFYWAIEQLGVEVLFREQVVVGAVIRSSIVKQVEGGLSAVFKLWVRQFFLSGANFSHGVTCHGSRSVFMIKAKINTILCDDAAKSGIWSAKGSSGIKSCMNCLNVVAARRDHHEGDGLVSIQCDNTSEFQLHTDDTVLAATDMLEEMASSRTTRVELECTEKTLGFKFNPAGILWDKSMRSLLGPISCSMEDWCHVFVVSGIANIELWLFLKHAEATSARLCFPDVFQFMNELTWPSACRNPPKGCFNETRSRSCHDADKFKCGASEYPLVNHIRLYLITNRFVSRYE